MEKRYQVFVSSTFVDLKDERQGIIQTLMEMDCIPAGMELFPAMDAEQWEFIKRVIDDCDYYVLVIGGRYGSMTTEGVSYTEMEFDYAVGKGIKVVAFLHGKPDDIPAGKTEKDAEARTKLEAFRKKVLDGRLVKTYTEAKELPGLLSLSLNKTIKAFPAVGWARANSVGNAELLNQLNTLRQANDALNAELQTLKAAAPAADIADIAGIDETIDVHAEYTSMNNRDYKYVFTVSWADLFSLISPSLISNPNQITVKKKLTSALFERQGINARSSSISDHDFDTIAIQLRVLGAVKIENRPTVGGGHGLFWRETPLGRQLMLQLRVIRSAKPPASAGVPDELPEVHREAVEAQQPQQQPPEAI